MTAASQQSHPVFAPPRRPGPGGGHVTVTATRHQHTPAAGRATVRRGVVDGARCAAGRAAGGAPVQSQPACCRRAAGARRRVCGQHRRRSARCEGRNLRSLTARAPCGAPGVGGASPARAATRIAAVGLLLGTSRNQQRAPGVWSPCLGRGTPIGAGNQHSDLPRTSGRGGLIPGFHASHSHLAPLISPQATMQPAQAPRRAGGNAPCLPRRPHPPLSGFVRRIITATGHASLGRTQVGSGGLVPLYHAPHRRGRRPAPPSPPCRCRWSSKLLAAAMT